MKKATEKQVNFIKNLLEQKSFKELDAEFLAEDISLLSGKKVNVNIDLNELENLDGWVASKLIDALLKAPTKEKAAADEARRVANFKAHDELVAKAKALGLKVRKNMKSATLREMISEVSLQK